MNPNRQTTARPKNEYDEQAEKFLLATDTRMVFTFIAHKPYFDAQEDARDVWLIELHHDLTKQKIQFTWGQSIANVGKQPRPYDVLAGLYTRSYPTLKDFCDEFGYEEDSMRSHSVWIAVNELAEKLSSFYSEKQLELLSEIQ